MSVRYCMILVFVSTLAFSQEAVKPRPSPLAMATARYKDAYIKITYSQPHKNGREIFGKLVPFNAVWRTGANEATEMTLTRDVRINGTDVKAGTYSLFTVPTPDKWTIILNADLGQWGSYNYNEKVDILRFEIPIVQLTDVVYEPFSIWFDARNDKAILYMAWDKTKVSIPIQFLEPKL